ncbi:[protein-PII] uridylyltransferase [Kribbia dieselivorans]|uniref:[protein-PII] uridylyltransferase n=1 Tax=Kribbia dieselivorans TaxID=331526 RepID=UPI00083910A8|nr:[protein-PII] uridylyltransferase [Kribbia dieselivorans]
MTADLAGLRVGAGAWDLSVPGAGRAARRRHTDATLAVLGEHFRDVVGSAQDGVALAVVGSLARGEAGPHSDLDLVLLHDPRLITTTRLDELADRLWYPLWDAGIALDHSVRSPAGCREVAATDLPAMMGLLDLQHVAGDPTPVAAARSTVGHDWRRAARTRLDDLLNLALARHERHGELSQLLDPDLKEARGGLRDATVMRGLTASWLADRTHGDVEAAIERLLDVRDAVHLVTGRGRDRLLREDHDDVALLLGLPDADALMVEVSLAGRAVAAALAATMRRARQSNGARLLTGRMRRPVLVPLGHGVFESAGEAVLAPDRSATSASATGQSGGFAADAHTPLRTALVAAQHHLPLSPTTARNLATCPDLPTPWPEDARSMLTDLLAAGDALLPVWESLDLAGVIEPWLPEWAIVRGRPQRSPIHRHTVERHLLTTVIEASRLVRSVARPDLLLLAALLHDIGKFPGAPDHSAAGARIAGRILARLGYDDRDTTAVVALVRDHLRLAELATTQDIAAPGTIGRAIALVDGSREMLELLLALTIADGSAVGPAAWSSGRAALITGLADLVRDRLPHDGGPDLVALPSGGRAALRALAVLPTSGQAPGVGSAPRPGPDVEPSILVEIETSPATGGYVVTVCGPDRLGLFADVAGALALERLSVRRALLHTQDGVACDQWWVSSVSGEAPGADRIRRRIEGSAGTARRLRIPAHAARLPATVIEHPAASVGWTVLEVRADDRDGLLRDLGEHLSRRRIAVHAARVATHAGQASDVLWLSDAQGQPLAADEVARLRIDLPRVADLGIRGGP